MIRAGVPLRGRVALVAGECLAAEWRGENIAVNSLAPGVSVFTDEIKRELKQGNPGLRHASPRMMTAPLLFLAEARAAEVSGQRLVAWDWLQGHGLGGWERWSAS